MRKAAAEEAEAQAADETAGKAKDAAQEAENPQEPGLRPVPRMSEPERGLPPRTGGEGRPRIDPSRTPPRPIIPPKPESDKDKKKRGKNG
jgi:hypothetical protein